MWQSTVREQRSDTLGNGDHGSCYTRSEHDVRSRTPPRNGQQHFDMLPTDPLAVSLDEGSSSSADEIGDRQSRTPAGSREHLLPIVTHTYIKTAWQSAIWEVPVGSECSASGRMVGKQDNPGLNSAAVPKCVASQLRECATKTVSE